MWGWQLALASPLQILGGLVPTLHDLCPWWRVDNVKRCRCDELTGDELTVWRHDRVTSWLCDELNGRRSQWKAVTQNRHLTFSITYNFLATKTAKPNFPYARPQIFCSPFLACHVLLSIVCKFCWQYNTNFSFRYVAIPSSADKQTRHSTKLVSQNIGVLLSHANAIM